MASAAQKIESACLFIVMSSMNIIPHLRVTWVDLGNILGG
jgi:hypothetical protein